MSRDYSNTGAVQGTGSFRFARINGKTGQIKINYNGEEFNVGAIKGYIDGFDAYYDKGNPDYKIAPHHGITIYLSATCPISGELGVRFKFDQSLHNAVIGPTVMNALLGSESKLSGDVMITISAWLKNDFPRCKIEIDDQRAENKFPYNDDIRWFDGVPRPKEMMNPVDDTTVKVWKDVYAFWSQHAQEFVSRMKAKFSMGQHESPEYTEDEKVSDTEKALEAFDEKFGAEEPTLKKIGQVELTTKLGQVDKITDAANLVKAYDNMLTYSLGEGQLKMAKAKFAMTAGKIGAKLEFTDTGAVALPEDDEDLPF